MNTQQLNPHQTLALDTKSLEKAWHDKVYAQNYTKEFPSDPAHFRELFRRVQLTPFCDGGWSYWGDARAAMMHAIGDVRGLHVLD